MRCYVARKTAVVVLTQTGLVEPQVLAGIHREGYNAVLTLRTKEQAKAYFQRFGTSDADVYVRPEELEFWREVIPGTLVVTRII